MKRKSKYELEKNSLILFSISMITAGLGTVFQILMGRLLPQPDFGVLNALLAFSTIVTVPSSIMLFGSAKYIAEYTARNELGYARHITSLFLRIAAFIGILSFLVLALLRNTFANILNIDNPNAIVAIGLMIMLSGIYSVIIGVLQGEKRFFAYGFIPMSSIGFRLIISVLIIVLGYSLSAIINSLFLSMLFPFLLGLFILRKFLARDSVAPADFSFRKLASFSGYTFLSYLFYNFYVSSDIIMIQSFDSTTAVSGAYSAAMQIGKAIIYIASAIAAVVFPMTAEYTATGKSTRPLIIKAVVLSAGIALIGAVAVNLFGGYAITLIFGERYSSAIPLLMPISIFAISLTMLTIIMNYSIASGRERDFSLSMIISSFCFYL